MRSIKKSGITALTAAIALSLGAVPVALTVPSIVASGEGSTSVTPATALTPGAIDAGTVELKTTSTKGIITYKTDTQEFTGGQQCEVTPIASTANLLTITGSVGPSQTGTARAGFRDGDIGVFETTTSSPDNASQCFRVDAGSTTTEESLTLELPADGPYSDQPFSERLLAESATVDAFTGNSRNGSIQIFLKDEGGEWVQQPALATWTNKRAGSQISIPVLTGGLFAGVRLTAKSGSFSVRGAKINLVSQADALFCNPGNANLNGTYETSDGATAVNYLGNADETNSCFGVKLTGGDRDYQWLKPLTVNQDAQFVFDQTWTIDPAPTVPDYGLNKAYINFELKLPVLDANGDPTVGEDGKPVTVDSEDHELLFCPDWLYPEGDPANELALITDDALLADGTTKVLDALADLDMEEDVDGVDGSQGTQFSCIDKKSRLTSFEIGTGTDGEDVLKVIDKIFLIGDAAYRF